MTASRSTWMPGCNKPSLLAFEAVLERFGVLAVCFIICVCVFFFFVCVCVCAEFFLSNLK